MVRARRGPSYVGDEIVAEERPRWGIADGGQIDDRGRRGARSLSAFEFCGIHRRQIVHFFALSPNRYRRVSREKHLSPPIPQFFCARSGGMGEMRGLLTIPWKLSTLFFIHDATKANAYSFFEQDQDQFSIREDFDSETPTGFIWGVNRGLLALPPLRGSFGLIHPRCAGGLTVSQSLFQS